MLNNNIKYNRMRIKKLSKKYRKNKEEKYGDMIREARLKYYF